MSDRPLQPTFFARDALTVARELLGSLLLVTNSEGSRGGLIVETEAYTQDDPASHSFMGPRDRNRVMFGPAGVAYVYLSYGVHACFNAVCGTDGIGAAVLVRALEPQIAVAGQWRARFGSRTPRTAIAELETPPAERTPARPPARNQSIPRELHEIAGGPGRLTQALGISLEDNGVLLDGRRIGVWGGAEVRQEWIRSTPRIGISKARERPWRFVIDGSPYLSRGRTTTRTARR